jgi:predicted phage gp36 major capsid-like protein
MGLGSIIGEKNCNQRANAIKNQKKRFWRTSRLAHSNSRAPIEQAFLTDDHGEQYRADRKEINVNAFSLTAKPSKQRRRPKLKRQSAANFGPRFKIAIA